MGPWLSDALLAGTVLAVANADSKPVQIKIASNAIAKRIGVSGDVSMP
jgi:hypothetical protein